MKNECFRERLEMLIRQYKEVVNRKNEKIFTWQWNF